MDGQDFTPETIEDVGKLMIIGYEGRDFEPEIAELITEFRPAGLIFFARNYPAEKSLETLKDTLEAAQTLAADILGRPLFLAIDHEGGLVQRLPAPFAKLPPAREVAEKLGGQAAYALVRRAGREIRSVGFNFNMAPVLDLAVSDAQFIGARSFGPDPRRALDFAKRYLNAYAESGVLCAAKHFPGLGRATLDPHFELPVINADRETIRAEAEIFHGLILEGLPAVMSTHALYPALDQVEPATFSAPIVSWLKDEMEFSGALLSDDLEMGAVVKNRPMGRAAVDCVKAGHDLLLICRRRDYIAECRNALAAALDSGEISRERIDDAHGRIEKILEKAGVGPSAEDLAAWYKTLEEKSVRLA